MDRPGAVLLDLDGTLYEQEAPIPGVADAVRRVRDGGITVRFVTNTTRLPRRLLAERLTVMGIPADQADVLTAPAAAAAWLRREGIRRAALHVAEATREDFPDVDAATARPEAVVVGDLGRDWTFDLLDTAFRQLIGGARLVALQRNRYWKTAAGLSLDAGPFVAALEYAAGVEATLVGKPSGAFFAAALATLAGETGPVVMVGDDVAGDVAGGQAAGCAGVLVRTGKYRAGDEATIAPGPDAVMDSVADLPVLFGL